MHHSPPFFFSSCILPYAIELQDWGGGGGADCEVSDESVKIGLSSGLSSICGNGVPRSSAGSFVKNCSQVSPRLSVAIPSRSQPLQKVMALVSENGRRVLAWVCALALYVAHTWYVCACLTRGGLLASLCDVTGVLGGRGSARCAPGSEP